eukprot:Unigene9380_Nuclearia_a/m.28634 Unigene9380_Nuclearia_a/g.28634  ORF Unigene9380_Nuclearia_a/g.28634 Unigene9380_Nuclearia_a/m.28634 type:complete len:245 (-) Unigene9380_Nuclearia_a:5-739(-)
MLLLDQRAYGGRAPCVQLRDAVVHAARFCHARDLAIVGTSNGARLYDLRFLPDVDTGGTLRGDHGSCVLELDAASGADEHAHALYASTAPADKSVFNAFTRRYEPVFVGHYHGDGWACDVNDVLPVPRSTWVVTTSAVDGLHKLWDVASGRGLATLRHSLDRACATLSTCGRFLLDVGGAGRDEVVVWDLDRAALGQRSTEVVRMSAWARGHLTRVVVNEAQTCAAAATTHGPLLYRHLMNETS